MSERPPSFLIVGAGGLGGPAALALTARGAGVTLCDHDVVELSNLQRQIQFRTSDIGRPKVEALASALIRRGAAPGSVRAVRRRFERDTARELLAGIDVVIDGTDSLPTKFAVSDAAVRLGVPFAIGGVLRYQGQVLAGRPGVTGCYRCVFERPPPEDADRCADAGVLGAIVGVVAGWLARAAFALAQGDDRLAGRVLVFDDVARAAEPREVPFRPRPGCRACARYARKEAS
jgi:adenylyltransferase/sulfurtransferase